MSVDDRHRMAQLHRGMPTNASINIPVSRNMVISDGLPIGRPGNSEAMQDHMIDDQSSPPPGGYQTGQQIKPNGATGTGRRMLPNLAMLYGRAGRQYSTESQQPLRDSRDSSLGEKRMGQFL